MIKDILHTTASNKNDELVHINEAEKGKAYYCPYCKNEFILRKSGKTGKGSKRPHFAHKQLSPNCTPEGYLHYTFKKQLISLLLKYKLENRALNINWKCNSCFKNYNNANILAKADRIEEEYYLKVCRPDIAVLDSEGNVLAVIEIVVTHEPEEGVLQYYEKNGIILVQINLSSEEDLEKVEEKISNPDFVNFCINTECSIFKNNEVRRDLVFSTKKCNRCKHPIRTCHVEVNSVFGLTKTTNFTVKEIRTAQLDSVRFKIIEDNNTKEKHPVISCLNCEINDERARERTRRMRMKYNGGGRL